MIWFFYGFVFLLPFQNHYLLNYKLSGDFTVLKAYGMGLLLYSVGYSVFHGLPRLWRTVQSKFLFLLSAKNHYNRVPDIMQAFMESSLAPSHKIGFAERGFVARG